VQNKTTFLKGKEKRKREKEEKKVVVVDSSSEEESFLESKSESEFDNITLAERTRQKRLLKKEKTRRIQKLQVNLKTSAVWVVLINKILFNLFKKANTASFECIYVNINVNVNINI